MLRKRRGLVGADPDPDVDDFCVVGHVEDDNTTVIIAVVVAGLLLIAVTGLVLTLVIRKFVLGKFSASFPSGSSLLFSEYRLSKSFVFHDFLFHIFPKEIKKGCLMFSHPDQCKSY